MPRRSSLAAAALLIAATPLAAVAQLCQGAPSFAQNHLQLAGSAVFTDAVTRSAVTWTAGSNSYFGGLGVGALTTDGVSGSSVLAIGQLGSQLSLSSRGGLQACPVLEAEYGFGPRDVDGAGTDLSTQAVGVGVHVGGALPRRGNVVLVPTVGVGMRYTAVRSEGTGGSNSQTDTYATVTAGLGLLLSEALVLRPSVLLPIRAADEDLRFGIAVAYNFGGRR